MELAISVDYMEPFGMATCALQGDRALVVATYEHVSMLYSVISTKHYPCQNAVAKKLTAGDIAHDLWHN